MFSTKLFSLKEILFFFLVTHCKKRFRTLYPSDHSDIKRSECNVIVNDTFPFGKQRINDSLSFRVQQQIVLPHILENFLDPHFYTFSLPLILGFVLSFHNAPKMLLSAVSLERGPKVAIIRLLTIRVAANIICTGSFCDQCKSC